MHAISCMNESKHVSTTTHVKSARIDRHSSRTCATQLCVTQCQSLHPALFVQHIDRLSRVLCMPSLLTQGGGVRCGQRAVRLSRSTDGSILACRCVRTWVAAVITPWVCAVQTPRKFALTMQFVDIIHLALLHGAAGGNPAVLAGV
jgi:hypothetical protein